MALLTVLSVQMRPGRSPAYEESIRRIAQRAADRKEGGRWQAQEVAFGSIGTLYFVQEHADWAALGEQDPPPVYLARLFGEREATKLYHEMTECLAELRYTVSQDRPDLSYAPQVHAAPPALTLVTFLRARPGSIPACEELIGKVAEAIPKADDPSRLLAYQTVIGDLRTYWTVRPIQRVEELDQVLPPQELLVRAFGAAEGDRIYRKGIDALQRAERQMTVLRPDLSYLG
ncbi:MAG TPA: hypothetical protein VKM54_11495 [Myxococcota bacterium]|nr:hypothetical protein [Myxococcota bacterium]